MSRDSRRPARSSRSPRRAARHAACSLLCLAIDWRSSARTGCGTRSSSLEQRHITPVLLSLSWLLPMNVLILVFNLVPAFPLDGGRIARAVVWRVTGDKLRGTRVAAKLGQGFAWILGRGRHLAAARPTGASPGSGCWPRVPARPVGPRRAAPDRGDPADRRRPGGRHHGPPSRWRSRRDAGRQALDEYFLRYGAAWFPVVDESTAASSGSSARSAPGRLRRRRGLADGRLGAGARRRLAPGA
jgi:hypothetical protein